MGIIILIIILAAIAFVYFNHQNNSNKLDRIVENTSAKIHELKRLNESIQFHNINKDILINKSYDNKSNFNKIEPAYLMSAELRSNIQNYATYIRLIQENRELNAVYYKELDKIYSKQHFIDYSALEITEEEYTKRESKIFNRLILCPTVDCNFKVSMSYSSPKGQVNLFKEEQFNFEQMLVSFNSISRSNLDRETYKNLSKVERGEVSDSLRYDVMNRDGFRCVICGASANEGVRLHVDHILPIAKGGKSNIENLRTLCERCNIGKSDKMETGFNNHQENYNSCPHCQGKLVLRTGKYGSFYGCENYPRCKYIKNINK